MKRGEKVPQPYTALQLLESMEEVGFLIFPGPGENLFVLPHDELGPQLRSYLHEHWNGVMHIVREAGGVVGVCPACRGRTPYWSGEWLKCLQCRGLPCDEEIPVRWVHIQKSGPET